MTTEMIERVARALSPNYDDADMCAYLAKSHGTTASAVQLTLREAAHAKARAAIEAMREPTEAMCLAPDSADICVDQFPINSAEAKSCWQAMIDAALKTEA